MLRLQETRAHTSRVKSTTATLPARKPASAGSAASKTAKASTLVARSGKTVKVGTTKDIERQFADNWDALG
jgi:hypothetical protein